MTKDKEAGGVQHVAQAGGNWIVGKTFKVKGEHRSESHCQARADRARHLSPPPSGTRTKSVVNSWQSGGCILTRGAKRGTVRSTETAQTE